jgi:cystathionine beta-lyase
MNFATKSVHAGVKPDPTTGAIMTPIYQTSTFVQSAPGEHKGYEYARGTNPTRDALQDAMAMLENGKAATCFSSGLGAMDAVLKMLKPGDEVISTNDLYGGSYRLFMNVFAKYGIGFHFVDMQDLGNIETVLNENTRMLWLETPTNPLMRIVDIEGAVAMVKGRNVVTVVDNTFASPALQNPLDLGADMVVHSMTKYLGGHSDLVMGCVVVNDPELDAHLKYINNAVGAVPGPMDSFLALRGIKTLSIRMKAHCENGKAVAHFLRNHPKVGQVYWPGFEDHPGHEVAKKQMKDFGGMLSFTLKEDSMDAAFSVLNKTKLFALAESLGGVESLIGHPASMTHGSIPKEEREKAGLSDTLIRLSVGIEDSQDLITDLEAALA